MEKFFKKVSKSSLVETSESHGEENLKRARIESDSSNLKTNLLRVDLDNLPSNPGLRIPIHEYDPNIQDQVQRLYLQRGPCQPRSHEFPRTKFGSKDRRFNHILFDKFSSWLEYSVSKDKTYCLCCYLFRQEGRGKEEDEAFNKNGFSNWKKPERFKLHVGGPNSLHSYARRYCEDLMKESQHIGLVFEKQTDRARMEYRIRLNTSVDCVRFLLKQCMAFRGHDETERSINQRNFLELLYFLSEHNEDINNVVLKNAPENLKLTAPDIQKEIINAAAILVTTFIVTELGDNFFSLLVDESRDISSKEQMATVIRYVNEQGQVVERFLGIVHVPETTVACLKMAIEQLFSTYGLSASRIRGQGYDGASNMRGEFNGLKALFLNGNKAAHFVHCFAHQLQLALIAVAKNHGQIDLLFTIVSNLMNIVGVSCKRRDQLREIQQEKVYQALESGAFPTGQGRNQEINLAIQDGVHIMNHWLD